MGSAASLPVLQSRFRLASLWLSQVARVLGDWTLRTVAFLEWGRRSHIDQQTAWHVATAVSITPFIVLAPLNGAICNSLPRRAVLVGSSAYTLSLVTLFAGIHGSWMLCLGLVALGAAVYSPARFAMLPAAAQDSAIPLPRVNGWIEMGSASAIVAGLALGWCVAGPRVAPESSWLAPATVLVSLNLFALLAALPTAFPSEVVRPDSPGRAVAGFFSDLGRTVRVRPALGSLLGLAGFQALVTAGAGALVAHSLAPALAGSGGFLRALAWIGLGTAIGCLVAGIPAHPRRNLGLVPLAALGLLGCLGWLQEAVQDTTGAIPVLPCLLLGFLCGLMTVPLRAAYQAAVPADCRGNSMSVQNTFIYLLMSLVALLMLVLGRPGLLHTPVQQLAVLMGLAAISTCLACKWLFPHAIELLTEGILLPVYRIRAVGPGRDVIPQHGPLLVVANHSAYMDPLWLSKVIPRHLTPMMTSLFYDRPVLRWLMVHVVGAIRVPTSRFRRETPELDQAIAELRRGGCVLIFPEAMLRRRDDQLLRLFGQGVWRILRAVPETPVVVCWIEGGWGSYTSYSNGLPMQGKPRDWWRPIHIAIERPQVLPAAVLADPRATRRALMQNCLGCRQYLGLEAAPRGKQVEWTASDISLPPEAPGEPSLPAG